MNRTTPSLGRRRNSAWAPSVGVATAALVAGLAFAASGSAGTVPRTTRVSVDGGGAQGNGDSATPAISADGSTVAFASDASNLIAGDANHHRDVFVRDVRTHRTRRVSVSFSGRQANGDSLPTTIDAIAGPSISAGGRYVAFASNASNLVPGDTNGVEDVFVRDLKKGLTRRVSMSSNGAQGNLESFQPSISTNGRYVAFASSASNLVRGDTNAAPDVFVRDLKAHTTRRVSVSSSGAQDNGADFRPSISADGRLVVFESPASNLVAGDTNGTFDVFAHDLRTHRTRRISVGSSGVEGDGGSYTGRQPSISGDRRYVVFYSLASNLVAGDANLSYDVFVRDLKRHTTRRVSVSSAGVPGDNDSYLPSISADGGRVAFESTADNLTGGDTNGSDDVFVRDLRRDSTRRVSVGSSGSQSNGPSEDASMAADGAYVAFDSVASDLVGRDSGAFADVFVRGPLR